MKPKRKSINSFVQNYASVVQLNNNGYEGDNNKKYKDKRLSVNKSDIKCSKK